VIHGLPSWPAPLQAFVLVASPRLGLRQFKWKTLKGFNTKIQIGASRERGPKNKHKNLENHLEGKPNKPKNASDVEPCHIRKIRLHNRNIECCEKPHLYPQGTMIHQKSYEMREKSNQNENPKEAQEVKKERLPLC